ncbi:MAG: sigma-70 family RNA polymerase sigma factor [Oceanococcaceae bacterium]
MHQGEIPAMTDTQPDLAELLGRTSLGDRTAFRRLYEHTSAHLFGLALRILRDESLAQEAVQDAYVQIWQKAEAYSESRGAVSTWLGSIVRYRALDMLRARKRLDFVDEVPEVDAIDPSGQWVDQTDLARCWPELSTEQQSALALSFVEGLSHAELSSRLDSPLGTIKSWVRRGLAVLKRCLEGVRHGD